MRFRNYDSLRSFVVVARHLNMGKAAVELNLTKGAVSYQIQQLEIELGFTVFSRIKRQLQLTEQGQALLQRSLGMFESVENEILRLRHRVNSRITIGMATYFASRWLSPRLMHFITEYPEIQLRIQPLVDLHDLTNHDIDIAIRWGKGDWRDQGMEVESVFQCPARLTASSDIGDDIQARGLEASIYDYVLLDDRENSTAWQDWFERAGLEWRPGAANLVIPDPNVRVQAVKDGQGIGLYDELVQDEIVAGNLYQDQTVELSEYGYFLIYPKSSHIDQQSLIEVFREWILEEAAIYQQ